MNVLGLTCGFSGSGSAAMPELPMNFGHDSAAVLISDGQLVAAVEEERLTRLKHTSNFCREAIRSCLEQANMTAADIDRFAYYFGEEENDRDLQLIYLQHPELTVRTSRDLLTDRLSEAVDTAVDPDRIAFVRHHTAHGFAAYHNSGFDSALVVVMDGKGDSESITIVSAEGTDYNYVRSFDEWRSLGRFYQRSIELLGYRAFDEYKVMGLAPYGDPSRYRSLFRSLYTLEDNGGYQLELERVRYTLVSEFRPRRKGEPFTKEHKDFAAGLQEALEDVALHVISHAQRETGHRRLCVGGGVGLNATLNGRLIRSGLFDETFFDPAAHDAGAAAGAALKVCQQEAPARFRSSPLRHLFLGPLPTSREPAETTLRRWGDFVEFRKSQDVCKETATFIAAGEIVAWVRGAAEFGPRALGHRSILADPRPESNKNRINAAVKKREGYRPFAPSVLEEYADKFFDIPPAAPDLYYMIAIVEVQPEFRELLGAVTHVDGTARVQVVNRATNDAYWQLIHDFGEITGVPVVLNTSFNNNAEPIVQTVDDAVVAFLTTDLDALVVDDWVVRKRKPRREAFLELTPTPMARTSLHSQRDIELGPQRPVVTNRIVLDAGRAHGVEISSAALDVLNAADGRRTLRQLGVTVPTTDNGLLDELLRLWDQRLLTLRPSTS
ncbi:carbamoyltransferase C-terminal domain-containing protein [Nocardia sp. NPDC046473]|uniref:carbamoyltransferase family protein n=1 Tax=Nocardia sp. NPDC046473 TaxID=3155733 RepID=UPI0033DFF07F